MELLDQILAALLVVLFFGLAVFIHEFGHYLAARLLHFRIDTFSIGFGPAIWKRKIGQTLYKVCILPLGGYVALPQLDPSSMDTLQGKTDREAIQPVPAWQRIIVALAGPLGNVVLAVALALLIAAVPSARTGSADTTVGIVDPASRAYAQGLRPGDRITAVQGTPVESWDDLLLECHLAGPEGQPVELTYTRAGAETKVSLPLELLYGELRTIGGIGPAGFAEVDRVLPNSPAEKAGIRPGDTLLALGGEPLLSPKRLLSRIQSETGTNTTLLVRREGRELLLELPPSEVVDGARRIGIVFSAQCAPGWMRHKRPLAQLKGDLDSILRVFRAFFAPKSKGEGSRAAKSLGGPILIIEQLYNSIRQNLFCGLGFLRFLCINLAFINLLPLPVLDGGHILFALFEVLTRRKLPKAFVERLVNLFAILLIGLMVLLIYKDVRRTIRLHSTPDLPAQASE